MRFYLFIVLMFISVGRVNSELITVCASGCDQTTLAGAKAAAVAATIRVTDNSIINENITIDGNTVLAIDFTNKTWGRTTSSNIITVTSGLTQPVSFLNIVFSQATNNPIFNYSSLADGSLVRFKNCRFPFPHNNGTLDLSVASTVIGQFIADSCVFDGTGSTAAFSCVWGNSADVAGSSVYVFKNCLIKNYAYRAIDSWNATAFSPILLQNCTLAGNAQAIQMGDPVSVLNCIFINNTDDLSGVNTSVSYSAFSEQSTTTGLGTGCMVGITSARTFCDPVNFFLSPASLTLNAGVSIDGVTGVDIGLNGVRQGSNNILGMGANPYSPALCPGLGAGK